jgi:hypothetical protein
MISNILFVVKVVTVQVTFVVSFLINAFAISQVRRTATNRLCWGILAEVLLAC